MSSSNLIHDSSPSGRDIQYTFSTIQDGQPLDFDNFPTFQFDVFDGSAGGRFDQDGTKLITTIVSTADPDLVFISPEQQQLTVTVPWDKDPVYDGGFARGIHQYDPLFKGEVYVYLTINMPDVGEQVAGKSMRNVRTQDSHPSKPAELYYPAEADRRKAKLKDRGLKPYSSPDPDSDPECYAVIDDGHAACPSATPGEIIIKPISANYIDGCPWSNSDTHSFRSSLTFEANYNCPKGPNDPSNPCTDMNEGAIVCHFAVISYVVRAWMPVAPGINPCPPGDDEQPAWIAAGSVKLDPCYQDEAGGLTGGVQQFTLSPMGFVGSDPQFRPGVPSFPFNSRVKIDFSVPSTSKNMALGACATTVYCEGYCCCPKTLCEDADDCTEEFEHRKWRVPNTTPESPTQGCCHYDDIDDLCCQGCEFTGKNKSPFEHCQVMYKGRKNACSTTACTTPDFGWDCDPDLYRVYWTGSDLFPCGKQYNFWLRLTDIE